MSNAANIAVFVSGGGTNLQALIDAQQDGVLHSGRLALVVSSKADAYALERAKMAGIPTVTVCKGDYATADLYGDALLAALAVHDIKLIVLAGFMSILSEGFIKGYRDRIVNVHPALIPSFCGKGYYGLRVHESVLAYGVKLTGATVHFVNEVPDGGAIILQQAVPVLNGDTPEQLQRRVMEQAEWPLLPRAAELFCAGRLHISGRTVIIDDE